MALEIERKFLVSGDAWRGLVAGVPFRQGYLADQNGCTVRVRIEGPRAVLTVKGRNTGMTRREHEFEIPQTEAAELLDHYCPKPLVEKVRYTIPYGGFVWEVDEFLGDNEGLVVAEIELESEDQTFDIPAWCSREVTGDPKYYNTSLARHPYALWPRNERL